MIRHKAMHPLLATVSLSSFTFCLLHSVCLSVFPSFRLSVWIFLDNNLVNGGVFVCVCGSCGLGLSDKSTAVNRRFLSSPASSGWPGGR